MSYHQHIEIGNYTQIRLIFSVEISDSGSVTNAIFANNPLSKSYPFYNFTGAPSSADGAANLVNGVFGMGNPFGPGNSGAPNLEIGTLLNSSNIDRYYEGMELLAGTGGPAPLGTIVSSARITSYNGEKRKCILDNSLSGTWGPTAPPSTIPNYNIDNADSNGFIYYKSDC